MQYSILNAENSLPSTEELVELYDAVGWSVYTRTPERLVPMLDGSRYLYVARENTAEGAERLIGLVRAVGRAVGDGQTIAYVQDLLVHPQAQRHGIGSALLGKIIADFDREGIRQRFITTDIVDTPVIELYRRFGFTPVQDNGCVTLAKYVF